ncbi:AAA family ATPase [Kribbella sp. NPDC048915]|uniref:AAA family ATPase n=1 Tax=Kribbella sp. NPDC048915 TaxID=3155148 RepID=UPI0033DE012B
MYEPDESPDGFPLEYGNIIIGLPSASQGTTSDDSAHRDEPADEPADVADSAADSAADEDQPSDQEEAVPADAAAEGDPAAEPTDPDPDEATEQVAGTDADRAEVAAEPLAGTTDAGEAEPEASDDADDAGRTAAADELAGAGDALSGTADAADADAGGADDSVRADVREADGEAGVVEAETADDAADAGHAAGESADPAASDDAEGAAGDGLAEPGVEAEQGAEAGVEAEQGAEAVVEAESGAETAVGSDESEASDVDDDAGVEEASEGQPGDSAADEDAGDSADDAAAGAGAGDAAGADASRADAGTDASAEAGAEGNDPVDGAVEGDAAAAEGAGAQEEPELSADELAARVAAEQAAMALITALMKLRGVLASSQLPLEVVGADEARKQQKAMLDQLDDYLLPRLVQLEAPILAVVGGSTGAGKSTLVNTVIGKVVSEPGVLRPTTRSPVLIHHPADADWFVGDRVLPGMARTSSDEPGGMEDPGQLRLVAADSVPRGLAILDAPDIDSVVEANRDLATQLLGAADLWLFVTTAARYSDAVPWEFLQSAADRSTAVAVVLDRAPGETIDDITGHLAQMLLERGLGDSPLFSIQETVVDSNGMLPDSAVASIRDWLVDLAADAEARAGVVRRTLQGAVSALVKTTPPLAEAVKAQAEAAIELRSAVESAYDQAVKDIAKACQDGTLLRGEVLARWQEFVGTGELLKGLQGNAGRLRDRLKTSFGNRPAETRDVSDAIQSGLESLLREHATEAAERAEKAWQATAPGRQLLATAANDAEGNGSESLGAVSAGFDAAAGRVVREWQKSVVELIRTEGANKKSTARILEYGVNGLGLSLMVVVFASETGIPKTAEAGAGAGSAVVAMRLLEAVFGDKAVLGMVDKAREDLDGKVHALMDAEFARYLAVLDQHPVDAETARQLTEAARAVEDCT